MSGWLVLTRRRGQKILVGDDVEVAVSEILDGKVRIAIRAPRETKVMRAELLDLGVCAVCESAEVMRLDDDRYRCLDCGDEWSGIRRRLAA